MDDMWHATFDDARAAEERWAREEFPKLLAQDAAHAFFQPPLEDPNL